MDTVGLYDLLPFIVKVRDAEASDGPDGPILKRILDCIQEQVDYTKLLIAGLRDLIDLDITQPLALSLICQSLGSRIPSDLPELESREFAKTLVDSYKIKGLLLSWRRQMKLLQLGDYTTIELYKSIPRENINYSLVRDDDHQLRAARVVFETPKGFGAIVESIYPWINKLIGIDWIGILGPIQWRELLESGQLDLFLYELGRELIIGQWFFSYDKLVENIVNPPNLLEYRQSLDLIHNLGDVVPIHVIPPVPCVSTIFAERVKDACDGLHGSKLTLSLLTCKSACQTLCENVLQAVGCVSVNQFGCSRRCETSCEISCERIKQAGCNTSDQFGCHIIVQECSGSCVVGCQKIQVGCETECQSVCQGMCQMRCQASCEGTNCEIRCEAVNCQISCQNQHTLDIDVLNIEEKCVSICQVDNCQTRCALGCEFKDCQTRCEDGCQLSCEKKCQQSCESFCQESCEKGCQNACQGYCQDGCQSRCTSNCQSQCTTRCMSSCQNFAESCRSLCQGGCQTQRQSTCQDACEEHCQTQLQTSGCVPVGGVCAGQCFAPVSPPSGAKREIESYQNTEDVLSGEEIVNSFEVEEGYGSPQAGSDCVFVREIGCSTLAETCKTGLQVTLSGRREKGPCSFFVELPRDSADNLSNKGRVTAKLSGYKINRVPVVVYGKNYVDKEVGYWGVTDEEGNVSIDVPLRKLTVKPIWFDYPLLAFLPNEKVVDFGIDPFPTIEFEVIGGAGRPRTTCVGLGKIWSGWFGENKNVGERGNFPRVEHNGWAKATNDECIRFLVEAGFESALEGFDIVGFWNYGQIIFDPVDFNIGQVNFLYLYDGDGRSVGELDRIIAWSPIIPPVFVEAKKTLKIPHRSQIFFRKVKSKRPFLGDHKVDKEQVPVQALVPRICETTCELQCQNTCTTACEIAHRDICKGGCQTWQTTGCLTSSETSSGHPGVSVPPQFDISPPSLGTTPSKSIKLKAARSWKWDTAPKYVYVTDIPSNITDTEGCWVLNDYSKQSKVKGGGWKSDSGNQTGGIYSDLKAENDLVTTTNRSRIWKLSGTWGTIFGVPDQAKIVQVRLSGIDIFYETTSSWVKDSDASLSCDKAVGFYLFKGIDRVPGNKWFYLTSLPFVPISARESEVKGDSKVEFALSSSVGPVVYYDNLTLEVLYEIPETSGCTNNCQTNCMSICQTGCAYTSQSSCGSKCEANTCQLSQCQAVWRQVSNCTTDCQTTCMVPGCQTVVQAVGKPTKTSCKTSCEWVCQTGCVNSCEKASCQVSCESVFQSKTCYFDCTFACTAKNCQADCQSSCQKLAQNPTTKVPGPFCDIRCETACQKSCQTGVEVGLPKFPVDSTVCVTINQASCIHTCETWQQNFVCQSSCQKSANQVPSGQSGACSAQCESSCVTSCETTGTETAFKGSCNYVCQTGCEIYCEGQSCEVLRELACHANCEGWKQTEGCSGVCQAASCQQGCEAEIQVVPCVTICQYRCMASCQQRCQISCESNGCQYSCEEYGRQS